MGEDPGDADLGPADAQLGGGLVDRCEHRLQGGAALHRPAWRQGAAVHGAEGQQSQALIPQQGEHLLLVAADPRAAVVVELGAAHGVVVLQAAGRRDPRRFGGLKQGPHRRRRVVGDPPVADAALVDEPLHALALGLGRGLGIGLVQQVEVDHLRAQPPQAGLALLAQELQGEGDAVPGPAVGGRLAPGQDLGADDDLVPPPPQGLTQQALGAPPAVGGGRVEEGDPHVEAVAQHRLAPRVRLVAGQALEGGPLAQAGDAQVGGAEGGGGQGGHL